jgi:hypothetical protein
MKLNLGIPRYFIKMPEPDVGIEPQSVFSVKMMKSEFIDQYHANLSALEMFGILKEQDVLTDKGIKTFVELKAWLIKYQIDYLEISQSEWWL